MIPGCLHQTIQDNKVHKFHETESEEVKATWISKIKIRFPDMQSPKRLYICECHFAPSSLTTTKTGLVQVKKGYGPTIFESLKPVSLEDQIAQLKASLKAVTKERDELSDLLDTCFLPDELKLMRGQKVREYSPEMIQKAIVVRMNTSQLGYLRLIELGYPLPSLRTLHSHIKHLDFSEGVMPSVLEALARIGKELRAQDPNHPDLQCILIADETSIDGRIMYDPSNKNIVGSVSDSFLRPDQKDAQVTGSKILTFMIKSIHSHQKQPVAWFFTSSLTASMMQNALNLITEKIENNTDFRIHGLCTDQGGANEGLWSLAQDGVSVPHPCDQRRRLFYLIDISHLLKNLWNSMIKTDLHLDPSVIHEVGSFGSHSLTQSKIDSPSTLDFFITLQERNKSVRVPVLKFKRLLLHPKDTWAKMRVYPTEVLFSHELANALVPAAEDFGDEQTVELSKTMSAFLHMMANFRMIASHTESDPNLLFDHTQRHLFGIVRRVFDTLTFSRNGKALTGPQKPKYPSGIRRFVDSTIGLFEYLELKKGTQSLALGQISSDFIENLFSRIKDQTGNPTPVQVSQRMQSVSLRSTAAASHTQNARPHKNTSYLDAKSLGVGTRKPVTAFDLDFHFEEDETFSLKPEHRAILWEIKNTIVQKISGSCSECSSKFTSPKSLDAFDLLFIFAMNTVDKNINILKNKDSEKYFRSWITEAASLDDYPGYDDMCHNNESIFQTFLTLFFTKIELLFDKSSIVYSSKSAMIKKIASLQ